MSDLIEDFQKEWEKIEEDLNLKTKEFFHIWLNKAIDKKNRELFCTCVEILGKVWNVKRTVPSEQFDVFAEHLFKNGKQIQKHEYKFWEKAFEVKTHAHSYESKICFAIAPEKYSLIYDGNVRTALKQAKIKVDLENFDTEAKKYTENKKCKTKEDYFELDFKLWQEGKKIKSKKGKK